MKGKVIDVDYVETLIKKKQKPSKTIDTTSVFSRRFDNKDAKTCWLNSCLQGMLSAIDYSELPKGFTSSLGKELLKMHSNENIEVKDPGSLLDIVCKADNDRVDLAIEDLQVNIQDPSLLRKRITSLENDRLALFGQQQCVRDFYISLTLNKSNWEDVFNFLHFKREELTRCGNPNCLVIISQNPEKCIYEEIEVPIYPSTLAKSIEAHFSQPKQIMWRCGNGCLKQTYSDHYTKIVNLKDTEYLTILLARAVWDSNGKPVLKDTDVNSADIVKIVENGEEFEYKAITVVSYMGNINSQGHSGGHYTADVLCKSNGKWYRTSDSMDPQEIEVSNISKNGILFLYKKIS